MPRFSLFLRGSSHLACLGIAGALLVAAGQPIVTNDLWWHAALGRSYMAHGPWLDQDPLLYTALGPPAASAWLFDTGVFALGQFGGFHALRLLHVSLVAATLVGAWWLLKRASQSALVASLGTATFVCLGAYRLVQLRPQLVTILATLLLYVLVIENRNQDAPSRRRILAATALLALWANFHAAFVLGPALLAASLAGVLLAMPYQPTETRARARRRAGALSLALVLGLAATLANPDGWSRYRDFLEVGASTPSLALVGDEWRRLDPMRLPVLELPPTPLAWGLFWCLLIAVPLAAIRAASGWRRGRDRPDAKPRIDPALVSLAFASLVGSFIAVRLLWLTIFSLLLLAHVARAWLGASPAPRWRPQLAAALAAALLCVGFFRLGDWRMLSASLPGSGNYLSLPYPPSRSFGHAVWLLADAGVEGNVFSEYALGGFLGFWLTPGLRSAANGTLNISLATLEANRAIREHRGALPGESYLDLLDRQSVDVFLGTRIPIASTSQRPRRSTTADLEGAPGWVTAFRTPRSAVYIRANSRNEANLAALNAYYEREGVPFDVKRGFDVAHVASEAPSWAVQHGVVPHNFQQLHTITASHDLPLRRLALNQLASIYAALGLYEQAIRIDAGLLETRPEAVGPRRRLVWSLLRTGRIEEAQQAADQRPEGTRVDSLTLEVFATAHALPTLADAEAAALMARLPAFRPAEAAKISATILPPTPRPWPRQTGKL